MDSTCDDLVFFSRLTNNLRTSCRFRVEANCPDEFILWATRANFPELKSSWQVSSMARKISSRALVLLGLLGTARLRDDVGRWFSLSMSQMVITEDQSLKMSHEKREHTERGRCEMILRWVYSGQLTPGINRTRSLHRGRNRANPLESEPTRA